MKKRRIGLLFLLVMAFCMMLSVFASADEPFSINKTRTTIYKGSKERLKVTGATGKVTWTSSNKKVATVSSKGLVRAKKPGVTYIYAKNNGQSVRCRVRVKSASITLDETELELEAGETEQLIAAVSGPSKDVTWKSSKTSVATVDQYGNVTAKNKAGTATITATANKVSAQCTVTVTKAQSASIVLDKEELYLEVDGTATLKATVSGMTGYTIQWSVDKPVKLGVTKTGTNTAQVTAYAETDDYEYVTVTAKIKGTSVFDTCQVTIDPNEEDKYVTRVELENRAAGNYTHGYLHGYNQFDEEVWCSPAVYAVPTGQYFHATTVTDWSRGRVYLVESTGISRFDMQTGSRDETYGKKAINVGSAPYACLDSAGNLYTVNAGEGKHIVRKITAEGTQITQLALIDTFYEPNDPQILSNGNLRIKGQGRYSSVVLRTTDLFVVGYY